MFHPFVLPFLIGALFFIIYLAYTWVKAFISLTNNSKSRFISGFFSIKLLFAIKEIVLESLLHLRLFKKNFLLGWMHMSLAFGWFLLIIVGTLESKFHSHGAFNPPYYPIFFKYFVHATNFPHSHLFFNLMDLLLIFILSAILLAVIKRFIPIMFGIKKKAEYKPIDKIALYSLWLIFPFRYLSESITSGLYGNGGFFTQTTGNLLSYLLPLQDIEIFAWWGYSSVLFIFFITLPFSRYMHIPSEVFLILLRNFGINRNENIKVVTQTEQFSCSKCGVCIDVCQLHKDLNLKHSPPLYLMTNERYGVISKKEILDCLLCGRCKEACPVGIDTISQRVYSRYKIINGKTIPRNFADLIFKDEKAEIAWFQGCMTHLTPSLIKAFKNILAKANISYTIIDPDGNICCGKPMHSIGKIDEAKKIINSVKNIITNLKPRILIVNCPICLNFFKTEYNLENITLMHHSEYIAKLIQEGTLEVIKKDDEYVYHDPCELGRGCNVLKEPEFVINKIGNLSNRIVKENSLCCGGSIGITSLSFENRKTITQKTIEELVGIGIENNAHLVTSCPLCKKTFQNSGFANVVDISEIVEKSLVS